MIQDMKATAPITVIIPTYNRGMKVFCTLEKTRLCDPAPAAIIIHIDQNDGRLEAELKKRYPEVDILTSAVRRGPGGGRHRCLLACKTPFAVSFDDDSYPVDTDFFASVEKLFSLHTKAAIMGAAIWHRNESEKSRSDVVVRAPSYIGCGYAIRLDAYRSIRGHLSRPIPYGMEETDLSLQLFSAGWHIYEAGALRVLHDTDLSHHSTKEITAGTITNTGLFAFLHYPFFAWGWGLAQVLNMVFRSLQKRRFSGICMGLVRIPVECFRNRRYRNPMDWQLLKSFLHFRRTGVLTPS
jgi:GT2 family glycosyltransferase